MNTYKLFGFSALCALSFSCSDSNKNKNYNFSIDNSTFKATYTKADQVDFKILNPDNHTIDSVIYYVNNTKLGKKEAIEDFKVNLKDYDLGYNYLRALVFVDGVETPISTRVEVLGTQEIKPLNYSIVNTYPHDLRAYTQGLEFDGNVLIESTGNGEGPTGKRGKSSIRRVNPKTGEVLQIVELTDDVFGEGATVLNDKIYQLTWRNVEGYVYDAKTLERLETFPYFSQIQGWGLTNDGTNLIMSDGSEKLYFVDPETKQKVKEVKVYSNRSKIQTINEMEYVNGKIYANLYQSDAVAVINPETGEIEAVLDLSALKTKITQHPDVDVLNGIAYNIETNTFFVTGKNWDKMFEIKITE
ncbi:glutaminyl-peptide cyclotransferase [Flavobacterium agricola]|uniref:Glutaminyl-peptide cyclotransferase n=1 Tax=Flavobacterium agricola TaxID=2870839 RepID=A0ABY6M2L7_9FLAO|nr:glutaminyl-peptide cyclotransferase [Flavobacterium agricola]UYW02052.1 glutaminyl-peptide cyclotransferase [Flavobacterium agricola]